MVLITGKRVDLELELVAKLVRASLSGMCRAERPTFICT